MIAIVYPQFYGVGGIARYLDSFLANLPEGAPRVLLVTGDEGRREVSYPGVEIVHIPFRSSRASLLRWGWDARKYLLERHAREGIGLVNLHWPPLIPGLFLPRSIPVVLTAHTTYLGMSGRFYGKEYYPSQWGRLSVAVKRWMEHRILARTRAVVALTEQGRQEVAGYGFPGDVHVVPNGADAAVFKPDAREKDIDVLFSGRIETRKGSRALAPVCRHLVERDPSIRICIVGYGDDEAAVRRELEPLSANVVLAGKTPFDRMLDYYSRSKVYASTSFYEGLPGTCLEAMAMKLPSVVWDFLFYDGLVRPGVTGLVVPPNDHRGMAEAVLSLLKDKVCREAMGEAARAALEERYAWRRLAAELVGILAKYTVARKGDAPKENA